MAKLKTLDKSRDSITRLATFLNPKGDSLDNLLRDTVLFCLKDSKVVWEFTAAGRQEIMQEPRFSDQHRRKQYNHHGEK